VGELSGSEIDRQACPDFLSDVRNIGVSDATREEPAMNAKVVVAMQHSPIGRGAFDPDDVAIALHHTMKARTRASGPNYLQAYEVRPRGHGRSAPHPRAEPPPRLHRSLSACRPRRSALCVAEMFAVVIGCRRHSSFATGFVLRARSLGPWLPASALRNAVIDIVVVGQPRQVVSPSRRLVAPAMVRGPRS